MFMRAHTCVWVGGGGGTFICQKSNMDGYPFLKLEHPKKGAGNN
jgi:hypothetical protein